MLEFKDTFEEYYDKIFSNEDFPEKEIVVKYYTDIRNKSVIRESYKRFLNNDLSEHTLYSISVEGGRKEFEKIFSIYKRNKKIYLLKSLLNFRRESLLIDLLDYLLEKEQSRLPYAFKILEFNPRSKFFLFSWYKENFNFIKDIYIHRELIKSLFKIYITDINREIRDYLIKRIREEKELINRYFEFSQILNNFVKRNKDIFKT